MHDPHIILQVAVAVEELCSAKVKLELLQDKSGTTLKELSAAGHAVRKMRAKLMVLLGKMIHKD